MGKAGFVGYLEALVCLIVHGVELADIGNGPRVEYNVIFCTWGRHAVDVGNKQASVIGTA